MDAATTTFDTAIVGAGIAGASLAWQLVQPVAGPGTVPPRVLLLEREAQPGMHSTGRSAAMWMPSYGPPAVRALTRVAGAFYAAPPAGFTDVPLLPPRGVLYVAAPGQQAALDALESELTPVCAGLQRLDVAATLARAPWLRADQLIGSLWDPESTDIDVHALHQGFLRGFRRAGGVLRCSAELQAAAWCSATGGGGAAGGAHAAHWHITLADGSVLQAARLVNAAGAWGDVLAARCGVAPVGLVPRRRSAFTFRAPAGVATAGWPLVASVDAEGDGWYVKPDAGQLLGSPANADDSVPHDVRPEDLDIALAVHRIEAATTLAVGRPTATWAGLRSFVADGELVLGADDAVPGFFWLVGQGGYGIQSAAGAAQLAAALLTGAPLSAALAGALAAEGTGPAALAVQRLRG